MAKTQRLELRLTEEDLAHLHRLADEQKLSVSEYVRRAALGRYADQPHTMPSEPPPGFGIPEKRPGAVSAIFADLRSR